MANTKKLSPAERRTAKRQVRRAIKKKFTELPKTDRKKFRKAHRTDKVNLLPWLRQREAEKKAAAQ